MRFDHATPNRPYRDACALCGEATSAYDLVQDMVERCLNRPPGPLAHADLWVEKGPLFARVRE